MSRRWLTGTFLFLLGFGCAKLMTLPAASAASTDGVVDGTLEYIDGDQNFELIYPPGGDAEYLVIAKRKVPPGATPVNRIRYEAGRAVISKQNLLDLTIYRAVPLVMWDGHTIRCEDMPWPDGPACPLPPPPPPPEDQSIDYTSVVPGRRH